MYWLYYRKNADLPKVIDGFGKGALDYVSGEELKEIVDEIDNDGTLSYSSTIIYSDEEFEEFYDYRDFDLENNDMLSRCNINFIKSEYEKVNLVDVLRIMKEREVRYYKSDI